MKRITFVPGAIVTPNPLTLPGDAPDMDIMVSAQIIRIPSSMTIPNHTQADIVGALADHAVHAHDLLFKANPAANAVTMAAASLHNASASDLTVAGAGADGGIRNNGATQAHSAGASAVAHGASVGANPVVAATPTLVTKRTFTLNVSTVLGDLLTIVYQAMGEVVHTS